MSLACPRCKASLLPLTYNGITIDKCPDCNGVWLDKGEVAFAQEILKHATDASCRDCNHFRKKNRQCNLLKIFVNSDFSCAHFSRM